VIEQQCRRLDVSRREKPSQCGARVCSQSASTSPQLFGVDRSLIPELLAPLLLISSPK
jgi:hypothetical protein